MLSLRSNADDTRSIVFAQGPSGSVQQNVASPYRNVLASGTLRHQRGESTSMSLTASYEDQTRHNQFNLGAALALYSGRPYSLTTGHDDFHTGVADARPAGVPRNSLEGPGYADLDLRWSRDLPFGQTPDGSSRALSVGIDAFNVLNRVNAAGYVGTLTSPFFGRLQLSLRVKF